MFLYGSVEPGGRWGIGRPGMVGSGVVGDLVLNDLQAERVGGIDEPLKGGEVTEVLVDAIEVDGAVAVVIGDGLAVILFTFVQVIYVVVDRSDPESRDAEILEVREMLQYPLKIASVIVTGLAPIVQTARDGRIVVGWIAIGKTVGHDEVDHIVGREALKA